MAAVDPKGELVVNSLGDIAFGQELNRAGALASLQSLDSGRATFPQLNGWTFCVSLTTVNATISGPCFQDTAT